MPAPIALLTDFGDGGYVAQMKGVVFGIVPDAAVVDVTHAIAPQNLRQAAIVLDSVVDAFPPQTLFVAVVDPGVGSSRRLVGVESRMHRFLAPDNGLLGEVLARELPVRVHALAEPRFWRRPVSNTFHGRDILAPVAAHWHRGVDLAEFGPAIPPDSLTRSVIPSPCCQPHAVTGEVVAVDPFGNLISNIRAEHVPESRRQHALARLRGGTDLAVRRFYAECPVGELLALFGSSGRLELAVNGGSAAERLNARSGAVVEIQWEPE